jgi:glutamate--cysteine ligase
MVPHLVTALSGPLRQLEQNLIQATPQIERWFRLEWQEHTPPFYGSVDVRNAGFKVAPIETNLFPAGFNHLADAMLPLAAQAATGAIEKYCPDARNLLLILENDTRDLRYFANVLRLEAIFRQAGLTVRFGTVNPDVLKAFAITLQDGRSVLIEPVKRNGRRLVVPASSAVGSSDFDPCTILLNNDLSLGIPETLKNLHEQVLLPPLHAGWSVRRKSNHFTAYNEVARKFAKAFDIDPWLITPYFANVKKVNFQETKAQELLATRVELLLKQIRTKYKEYGITDAPFVVVKADAGTYGAVVMSVKDASEVMSLSGLQKDRIAGARVSAQPTDVLLQEGLPTIETVDNATAEPVVYTIDRFVVGGFYRVNTQRGPEENLVSPSMHFKPLPFAKPCNMPDCGEDTTAAPNRFYTYGVIARLALLAAAIELERTDPDQSQYG